MSKTIEEEKEVFYASYVKIPTTIHWNFMSVLLISQTFKVFFLVFKVFLWLYYFFKYKNIQVSRISQ